MLISGRAATVADVATVAIGQAGPSLLPGARQSDGRGLNPCRLDCPHLLAPQKGKAPGLLRSPTLPARGGTSARAAISFYIITTTAAVLYRTHSGLAGG